MKDWIISVYDTETNTKETSSKQNTRLASVRQNNVPVEEKKDPHPLLLRHPFRMQSLSARMRR